MRILLADDHPQVRWALRTAIKAQTNFSLVGEITEASQLLPQAEALQPDLIFLEWEMSGDPAGSMLQSLRRLVHPLRLIILSRNAQLRDTALAAGADAFVSKADPPEPLLTVLQTLTNTNLGRRNQK
jgi:DNA-binding NarL/FixJ family response regulator